jgi:DNA-binding transcriptional regulator YdaS (Cro superfamily)
VKLIDYLSEERGRARRMAARLGINAGYLSQFAHGGRPVPPELCPEIERLSGGAVRRSDLRPDDWHRIWPELVGIEGAPDVAGAEGRASEPPASGLPADLRQGERRVAVDPELLGVVDLHARPFDVERRHSEAERRAAGHATVAAVEKAQQRAGDADAAGEWGV